jgi:multidrug efflux pump subunit AcrB
MSRNPSRTRVNTVAGIKRLLSASYEGLGFTWIEFRLDVDQTRVLQEVRDKVAQIRATFPREVKDPVVQRGGDENDEPVAFLRTARRRPEPAANSPCSRSRSCRKGLERVNGVGRVTLGGTVSRQIQVRVDPVKLTALGLTVDQVVAALRNANVACRSAPSRTAPRGDRGASTGASRRRRISARSSCAQGVARRSCCRRSPRSSTAERERISIARINGKPAISIRGVQGAGCERRRGRQRLKLAADKVRKQLPPGTELRLLRSTRSSSSVGGQRQDHHHRGRPAYRADRVPVPRLVAQHRDHRALRCRSR